MIVFIRSSPRLHGRMSMPWSSMRARSCRNSPAGSIGPEVELTFGEMDNPFEEEFQEEEAVARRYGETPSPLASLAMPLRREDVRVVSEPETEVEPDNADVVMIGDGIKQSHGSSAGVAVARKPRYNQLFVVCIT